MKPDTPRPRTAKSPRKPAASGTSKRKSAVRLVAGRDVLGTSGPITVEMVREGFSPNTLSELGATLGLAVGAMLPLVNMTKQTYQRRVKAGKLTPAESDRVWRVADLVVKATKLLGSEEGAAAWLRTPAPALDGETPLERATSEVGARDVERLIGRLAHGIPA